MSLIDTDCMSKKRSRNSCHAWVPEGLVVSKAITSSLVVKRCNAVEFPFERCHHRHELCAIFIVHRFGVWQFKTQCIDLNAIFPESVTNMRAGCQSGAPDFPDN